MSGLGRRLRRQFGPLQEIARAAWQNRDQPGYAWRILNHGVCDGCALGLGNRPVRIPLVDIALVAFALWLGRRRGLPSRRHEPPRRRSE